MRWVWVLCLTVIMLGSTGQTRAQGRVIPPDAVILRNGAMFRGTVSEAIPGRHVTVVLATGSLRTFEWEDVRFAGPASDLPPQGPVPPPPGAGSHESPGDAAPRTAPPRTRSSEDANGLTAAPPASVNIPTPPSDPAGLEGVYAGTGMTARAPGGVEGPPPVPVTLRAGGNDQLSVHVHESALVQGDAALGFDRRSRYRPL